jgi:two-component system CheB/CheR fusion protein
MELTDGNAFITACVELISHYVPEHQVTITLDATLPIMVDKLRVEQVINNLVINAAKYSTPGSTIFISTTVDAENLFIHVRDEGIGMSNETIENVFNKFYRSENVAHSYRGLGMGLYIASRIVGDHKGDIQVKSKEGEGSTFTVRLPTAKAN